jgi:hypothetical protein
LNFGRKLVVFMNNKRRLYHELALEITAKYNFGKISVVMRPRVDHPQRLWTEIRNGADPKELREL